MTSSITGMNGDAPSRVSSEGLANVQRVRDLIEKLRPEQFDMMKPSTGGCGSAACIMGWAETLMQPNPHKWRFFERDVIGDWMGLSEDQWENLFFPTFGDLGNGRKPYDATPAEAVQVLDHLIATGEVDWSVSAGVEQLSQPSTNGRRANTILPEEERLS